MQHYSLLLYCLHMLFISTTDINKNLCFMTHELVVYILEKVIIVYQMLRLLTIILSITIRFILLFSVYGQVCQQSRLNWAYPSALFIRFCIEWVFRHSKPFKNMKKSLKYKTTNDVTKLKETKRQNLFETPNVRAGSKFEYQSGSDFQTEVIF